jgi:hypothetical protein
MPPVMKATQKFDEANKMPIEPGDTIVVIDGRYLNCSHYLHFYEHK